MPRNSFKLDVVSVRLVEDAPILSEHPLNSPEAAIEVIGQYLRNFDREVVCVINLSGSLVPINCHFVSMGTLSNALVHPREIFKSSILSNAYGILLIHCHPGGSLVPSKADCRVTDQMMKVCGLMDIPLLDHIIVSRKRDGYFSFKEKGKLEYPHIALTADLETLDVRSMVAEQVERRNRIGRHKKNNV